MATLTSFLLPTLSVPKATITPMSLPKGREMKMKARSSVSKLIFRGEVTEYRYLLYLACLCVGLSVAALHHDYKCVLLFFVSLFVLYDVQNVCRLRPSATPCGALHVSCFAQGY